MSALDLVMTLMYSLYNQQSDMSPRRDTNGTKNASKKTDGELQYQRDT